jgi:hypothetical protein
MSQLPLQRHAATLRLLALHFGLPELERVARAPGVMEAFRVTLQYHDARHPDQVATLIKFQAVGPAKLAVYYRLPDDRTLTYDHEIPIERFRALVGALRKLDFDRLDDLPNLPSHGADLWLVERASGTFHHDLALSPEHASGKHTELVELIRKHLRESVRAIEPRS